jgi:hypothetical protein
MNKDLQDIGHDFTSQWFQRKAGKIATGYFPVHILYNENTALLR